MTTVAARGQRITIVHLILLTALLSIGLLEAFVVQRHYFSAVSAMSFAKKSPVIDLTGDDSPERKKTRRSSPQSSAASSHENSVDLSLVSYNIWFDPLYQKERMQALHQAILNTTGSLPRWIGLQEVTQSLASVLYPLLEETGYTMITQPNAPYGCALALQVDQVLDSGFVPFQDSIMGRGILWATTRVGSHSILFTTTHLESFVKNYMGSTYTGSTQRESQLRQLKGFCQDNINNKVVDVAIITGDLNWDDERTRSTGMDKPMMNIMGEGWMDAWKRHCPQEAGYTYDAKLNGMLRGNLRRRFDRCLVRSNLPFTVTDTELIGKENIPGLVRNNGKSRGTNLVLPSDHYGLRVMLQLNSDKK